MICETTLCCFCSEVVSKLGVVIFNSDKFKLQAHGSQYST